MQTKYSFMAKDIVFKVNFHPQPKYNNVVTTAKEESIINNLECYYGSEHVFTFILSLFSDQFPHFFPQLIA